ncbi:MFS transporter [uncultured Nitratireductor sp.]|uniref:MFS transporter n=1 Tax=uncultured Nitratireductor sp. TaxID=520953 RepID=UPI0025DEE3C7|nr:MFS transporter [uncultured Nitratireductor sp.]
MLASTETRRAGRREWIGLAVLALPCMLYSMDMTVLNLAVPHLSADLKPSGAELLWIVDIYGFLLAGALITMGTLGDRIGRRKLLLIGATAFGLASILAAFSTTPAMLIASRALLGLAAATLAPSTLSLLRNMFHDPAQRTFAIGVWIASFSAGAAIGPLVGGVLLAYFWWGSVFLIAVPIMLLLLLIGPALLPEFRDPDAGRLDLMSAALSLAAILAIIYGIKHIAEIGLSGEAAVAIGAGMAIGILFMLRQRRLADPLIDISLFAKPAFSASLLVNLMAFFIAFGSFLFIAQFLQLVLGLSPLAAGLWSLPSGIAFIAGSMITPLLAQSIRPPFLMAAGLILAAIGFGLVAWAAQTTDLVAMIIAFTVFSIGLAPVFTLTTDLVVGTVTPERAGAASAIAETCTELGGALGIAVLGSVVTAIYRTGMAATPQSGPAYEAVRDTLGGALTVAQDLPTESATMLVENARLAFSNGLVVASVVCAVISLVAAFVAAVMLRRVGLQEPEDGTLAPAE